MLDPHLCGLVGELVSEVQDPSFRPRKQFERRPERRPRLGIVVHKVYVAQLDVQIHTISKTPFKATLLLLLLLEQIWVRRPLHKVHHWIHSTICFNPDARYRQCDKVLWVFVLFFAVLKPVLGKDDVCWHCEFTLVFILIFAFVLVAATPHRRGVQEPLCFVLRYYLHLKREGF